MKLKFLAKHMPKYRGIDGLGGHLEMSKGDSADVGETIARLLLQRYRHDFEIVLEEKPQHAPKEDKQLKKTVTFKSK